MADFRVQLIRSSRLRLGEAPRSFDASFTRYLRVKRPMLAIGLPKHLKAAYNMHSFLLQHGHVVWGTLVVASNDLFSKGRNDGRGVIVYCPQIHLHDDLGRLIDVAQKLSDLRNRRTANDAEQQIRHNLNRNRKWFAPEHVPESVGGDGNVLISSILCVRKHLPRGLVGGNCFPILTHPDTTSVAVLPEYYWPDDLRATWMGGK